MIAGTTPASPDDGGAADPRLVIALDGGDAASVNLALLHARLLVPVVALPVVGMSGAVDAEMAVPALVSDDGRRALPVFSSYDALRAWRAEARPVPMPGTRVMAGAAAEGYAAVVLDVAGPVTHVVEAADLRLMADAGRRLLADPALSVAAVGSAAEGPARKAPGC